MDLLPFMEQTTVSHQMSEHKRVSIIIFHSSNWWKCIFVVNSLRGDCFLANWCEYIFFIVVSMWMPTIQIENYSERRKTRQFFFLRYFCFFTIKCITSPSSASGKLMTRFIMMNEIRTFASVRELRKDRRVGMSACLLSLIGNFDGETLHLPLSTNFLWLWEQENLTILFLLPFWRDFPYFHRAVDLTEWGK